MRRVFPVLIALLLIPAAVPSGVAAVGTAPTESPVFDSGIIQPSTNQSQLQSNTTNETERPPISGIAFFTTYDRDASPPVRIGFSTSEAADGFFVLENESGAVVGRTDYRTFSGELAVDGLAVPFTRPVTGLVNLTVVAYDDTNGNMTFDPGIDEPYRNQDGSRVAASLPFLFANESGAITVEETTLEPAAPGETGLHHARLEAQRDLTVRSVALNYRYTGIDVSGVTNESAGVGMMYPEKSAYRTGSVDVSRPLGNVIVVTPDDPFEAAEGEDFVVNVDGLEIPAERTNVTVVVNPDNNTQSHAATATFEPGRSTPEIVHFQSGPEDPSTVEANLYFPTETTGVVVVESDGEVIGRSDPVGGQPDMHVDFLPVRLERPLQHGEEITATLYRDADGDGEYEEPFTFEGEPVSTSITVSGGQETTEPATSTTESMDTTTRPPATNTTRTTTPGLGFGVAVLGLLGVGFLLGRS